MVSIIKINYQQKILINTTSKNEIKIKNSIAKENKK
jgi:hypothetical protein